MDQTVAVGYSMSLHVHVPPAVKWYIRAYIENYQSVELDPDKQQNPQSF